MTCRVWLSIRLESREISELNSTTAFLSATLISNESCKFSGKESLMGNLLLFHRGSTEFWTDVMKPLALTLNVWSTKPNTTFSFGWITLN